MRMAPATTDLTATGRIPSPFEAPVLQPVERVDPQDAVRIAEEQARREGFETGYRAGIDLAEAEVNAAVEAHQHAAARLERAAAALEEGRRQLLASDRLELEAIERDVIELAMALATEIVGRELRATDEPVRDALARALQLVPDRRTPVVIVHPDDAETARDALAADLRFGAGIELAADRRVEPGGCVVEVGDCRIDGQIGPAIARVRDVLGAG